jgi:hypothetical protein
MSTAIDSNVLAALWDAEDALNTLARAALDAAQRRGNLVISGPVFAELLASRGRDEAFIDSFCMRTGIQIEWELSESVWRLAGRSFQAYAGRRRTQSPAGPRWILADFLIGAHAMQGGYHLLTLDEGLYRAAFPRLTILTA